MNTGQWILYAVVLATLLVSACGGGGSDGPQATSPEFTVATSFNEGGSLSPASQEVTEGEAVALSVATDEGFSLASIQGCGGSLSGTVFTTGPVEAACTVTANFALNQYDLTGNASSGGAIAPESQSVDHGSSAEFTLSADFGYRLDSVSGCDGTLSGDVFSTGLVTEACSVSADFSLLALSAPANPEASAGVRRVQIRWDEVDDAAQYNLFYGTDPGIDINNSASYLDQVMDVSSPVWVDDLTNGDDYYFVVIAATGPAESPASAEVTAQPFAGAVSTFFGTSGTGHESLAVLQHPINSDVYALLMVNDPVAPTTPGAWITSFSGCSGMSRCSMVVRFSADLSEMVSATYLPFTGFFTSNTRAGGNAMIVDPATGDLIIAGATGNTMTAQGLRDQSGTPVIDPDTGVAYQPYQSSAVETSAAIVRLKADLSAPLAATYYGTSGTQSFTGVVLHPLNGDLYLTGYTTSAAALPEVTGGAQPAFAGGSNDLILVRFSPELHQVRQSTFLGGGGSTALGVDWGASNDKTHNGIAIHPTSGDVYVVNSTASTSFPTTSGALQESKSSTSTDGFVSRLNADLTELLSSTYFGGSNQWNVTAIAVNDVGEVVIAGRASFNLPGREGGAQPQLLGGAGNAGYVARLEPDLSAVVQSTYFGVPLSAGTVQTVKALVLHPVTAEVYVVGHASGDLPELDFALLEENPNPARQGAFMARFTSELTELHQSTWMGSRVKSPHSVAISQDGDWAYSLFVDTAGSHPFSAEGAYPTNPGGESVLVIRLRSSLSR